MCTGVPGIGVPDVELLLYIGLLVLDPDNGVPGPRTGVPTMNADRLISICDMSGWMLAASGCIVIALFTDGLAAGNRHICWGIGVERSADSWVGKCGFSGTSFLRIQHQIYINIKTFLLYYIYSLA